MVKKPLPDMKVPILKNNSSVYTPEGYEPGMTITSLEGLLMYSGNKFFSGYKLVDWSWIEYQTLRSLLLSIKLGTLRLARAKSKEQRLIDANIRKSRRATTPLLSTKHS